jgi:hypothetical protein
MRGWDALISMNVPNKLPVKSDNNAEICTEDICVCAREGTGSILNQVIALTSMNASKDTVVEVKNASTLMEVSTVSALRG